MQSIVSVDVSEEGCENNPINEQRCDDHVTLGLSDFMRLQKNMRAAPQREAEKCSAVGEPSVSLGLCQLSGEAGGSAGWSRLTSVAAHLPTDDRRRDFTPTTCPRK